MASREDLKGWVVEALAAHGGEATLLQVAHYLWANYQDELWASDDLFYTWQYDMRWAATKLRQEGRMEPKERGSRDPWRLA